MSPIPQFQAYSDVAVVWKIYLWSLVLPQTIGSSSFSTCSKIWRKPKWSYKEPNKTLKNNIPHLITFCSNQGSFIYNSFNGIPQNKYSRLTDNAVHPGTQVRTYLKQNWQQLFTGIWKKEHSDKTLFKQFSFIKVVSLVVTQIIGLTMQALYDL